MNQPKNVIFGDSPHPLRYKISKWGQLKNVKSNNSKKIHIVISEFFIDDRLSNGTRIEVVHDDYGTLFATIVGAQGSLITEFQDNMVFELPPSYILAELDKFGIYVEYEPNNDISKAQLDYIRTLKGLGYDKLRILYVHKYINGKKHIDWYVVAFNIKENPQWLNNAYSPPEKEFRDSILNGSAINISAISQTQKYRWDWLVDFVANIDDILEG